MKQLIFKRKPIEGKIPRELLIKDIREMTGIIENAHPDPYFNGGGKVAYHKRLQELIRDLPTEGLGPEEAYMRMQMFLATLNDGHTLLLPPDNMMNRNNPGGLPLFFDMVYDSVYVKAVNHKTDHSLLGCLLLEVEGVGLDELSKRIAATIGSENKYAILGRIVNRHLFAFRPFLRHLVPEWKGNSIQVTVKDPDGKISRHDLPPAIGFEQHTLEQGSSSPYGSNASFSYRFIDDVAVLRIDGTDIVREVYENIPQQKLKGRERQIVENYKLYHKKEPHEMELAEMVDALPSAYETFCNLFTELRQKQTADLVVDLRYNEGGTSTLQYLFLYFIAGFARIRDILERPIEVQKYSTYYQNSTSKIKLEEVGYHDKVPLTIDDYDFSSYSNFSTKPFTVEYVTKALTKYFASISPSLSKEMQVREFEGHYTPTNIYVLTSPTTFSSGFDLAVSLYEMGAKLVGVPSGQAPTFYGNVIRWQLKHSQLRGMNATKLFMKFPDKQHENVLMPDYLLTYELLCKYNFDENASLLLALDTIKAF